MSHPPGGHQHARGDLVAVGDADPSVEQWALTISSTQSAIGLPRGERVSHPGVAHGDAVADAGDTEHERDPSGLDDPLLDLLHQLIEVDMTRDDIVPGVGDADERLGHVLGGHSRRPQQAPAGRLVEPLLDLIAPHLIPSVMMLR